MTLINQNTKERDLQTHRNYFTLHSFSAQHLINLF
jgi:hypothetical protein